MVSEDSDELVPGFSPVHRLHDLDDLRQTRLGQMVIAGNEFNAVSELLEVIPLRRTERMLPEERNDPLKQIRSTGHAAPVDVFPVVVGPPVHVHLAHAEELTQFMEALDARRALCHHEVMRDLISGPVAASARSVMLPNESDREASFSVYETSYPATELGQPFLLIVRTRHVVTTVNVRSDGTVSSAGYSEFPAYSQMRTVLLPARGAAMYLRTVIVTAAVYWGFNSKLRLR